MDKALLPRVQAFLRFLNQDLEHTSREQIGELFAGLAVALGYHLELDISVASPIEALAKHFRGLGRGGLFLVQVGLRTYFEKLMNRYETICGKQEDMQTRWIPVEQHVELCALEEFKLELTMQPYIDLESNAQPDNVRGGKDLVQWNEGASTAAHLRVHALSKDPLDHFMYHFLQCLDGVSLSDFKKCKECEGWFLLTSKRERSFCSSRCASKMANRERYEKLKKRDPQRLERELAKGRERAHQSYEKRVKRDHPNAKVTR
ncbi:MAG: hypothetical protein FJY85_12425 [Deltaproteobacteria bacterium]|nr:hypothetical protein [Deltaproteobacteria bacterium]